MAESAATSIGFLASAFGLGHLLDGLYTPPDNDGTAVSVKLGLNKNDTNTGQGGDLIAVYAYDASNAYLGSGTNTPGASAAGALVQIPIGQKEPDRQGKYVSVSAGDDDICVLWASVNQHDGSYQGLWNGDIGRYCGQGWYHGGVETLGTIGDGDNKQPWMPACTWFGNPQEMHGAVSHSWKFNTLAYGDGSSATLANNVVCEATIYSPDIGVISDEPGGDPPAVTKRSATSLPLPAKRSAWIEQTLIVSDLPHQTAEELCTDGMSYGPDFVDSKGEYCDMETKTLLPVCSDASVTGCVTLSDDKMTISKRDKVMRRTVESVHKSFEKVRHWSQE